MKRVSSDLNRFSVQFLPAPPQVFGKSHSENHRSQILLISLLNVSKNFSMNSALSFASLLPVFVYILSATCLRLSSYSRFEECFEKSIIVPSCRIFLRL